MIPYLLITEKEFKKLITFKYSYKRYIFTLLWYSVLGMGIYYNKYIIPGLGDFGDRYYGTN